MEEQPTTSTDELAHKIARLVEERGWNQGDFARIAQLNRHTARQILLQGRRAPDADESEEDDGASETRRLRNATISACAKALGLSVNDLRTEPLEKLLPRMTEGASRTEGGASTGLRRLYKQATQPELRAWVERNPDRARELTEDEIDELLALQGDAGPLQAFGVEGFVVRLERRRKLFQQIHAIAGTEYLELLEQLVGLLYDKVRPAQTHK